MRKKLVNYFEVWTCDGGEQSQQKHDEEGEDSTRIPAGW